MERALRRAEDPPGRDPRPAPVPGAALLGPDRDDAAGRRPGPRAAADDARPDRAREVRLRRHRRAARGSHRVRAAARLRLRRGVADPHDPPRLRQVAPRPGRARRRDDRRGRRGARRLGEGARGQRLRPLPPPPRARGRAEAPLHRLLRGLRRAVRRPPRRLRAGDEDGRGAGGLRRPEGGARAADRRDRLGRRRRRVHVRPVADRRAARLLAGHHQALRLRRVVRAARPDRAPVRRQLGHAGHPPDDALQGGRHHVDLHGDARVRARPLRARRLAVARADAALPRRLLGAARVAEPDVGEHRRPQPRSSGTTSTRRSRRRSPRPSATSTRSASTGRSTG